ncbi:MAG: hypothetical protein ABL986_23430 [Vicinamibacterales bacterium]
MPALRLIARDTPYHDDEFGLRARLRGASAESLIERYNVSIGCTAWVRARGLYLIALREALLATGLDCSAFIDETGMRLNTPVRLVGDRLVPGR